MDLASVWQEHKRFIALCAIGGVGFLAGMLAIRGTLGADARAARTRKSSLERQLSGGMYGRGEQDRAQADRDALASKVDELRALVDFAPRPGFALDPTRGSAAGQYLAAVQSVHDQLLPAAGRAGLVLDRDLGLPPLSPTREEEIARVLEGLDLVERSVRLAIASGVERIPEIEIRLDPSLSSRAGVATIERTEVRLSARGDGRALASFVRRTQDGAAPLIVLEADLSTVRSKGEEASLELTLAAVRLHEPAGDESAPGEAL
jgi:hypothetical protein